MSAIKGLSDLTTSLALDHKASLAAARSLYVCRVCMPDMYAVYLIYGTRIRHTYKAHRPGARENDTSKAHI